MLDWSSFSVYNNLQDNFIVTKIFRILSPLWEM